MAKETEARTPSTEIVELPSRALGIIDTLGIKLADPVDIQWRIAERLALANSADELLNGMGPEGLREHLGEAFQIRSVDYLRSAFPGAPLYAVIGAVNRDGEPVLYTTGALSVVIQVAKGMQMDWWKDKWVSAEYSTSEPTADGNRPYMLKQA